MSLHIDGKRLDNNWVLNDIIGNQYRPSIETHLLRLLSKHLARWCTERWILVTQPGESYEPKLCGAHP